MKDYIVTLDVYVFGVEDKSTAIDKAMAAIERGGLSGDVLNTLEGTIDASDPDDHIGRTHVASPKSKA